MRQLKKGRVNLQCKDSSKDGYMIVFTISLNPDPILFSDLDPL